MSESGDEQLTVLARQGGERVVMAARMFHAEKQLVFARLRDRGIHDAVDLKMAALEQLYGNELTESQRAGIRARLVSRAALENRR